MSMITSYQLVLILLFCLSNVGHSLLCYNCSATHTAWSQCGGEFGNPSCLFNSTRKLLVNCTGERAMCFVRMWTARTKHAWLVQRGCYLVPEEDVMVRTVSNPIRAMACKQEKYPDGDYKLCLCQADWCNSAVAAAALSYIHVWIIIGFVYFWSRYFRDCNI